jgi:hypothetical protein
MNTIAIIIPNEVKEGQILQRKSGLGEELGSALAGQNSRIKI